MSALSCLTSGTIVEFSIKTAYDVLGFKQTSRSATQNRSEGERYLSRVGAQVALIDRTSCLRTPQASRLPPQQRRHRCERPRIAYP